MRILLKKVRIIAPGQALDGQVRDLLVEEGIIRKIAEEINTDAEHTFFKENIHVSPGWMDVFSHFCDPGFEYKEDLESGSKSAVAGGFTGIMVIPNTCPPLESKAEIEYVIRKSQYLPVNIFPIGAVSRELGGKALAEMYDMKQSGAIAFSDGILPLQSSGLLLKALQYVKAFNGIIIQIPDDTGISHHGLMHEGIWSTRLGMPGKPAIAEEILVERDLKLLKYTESRLHFTGVSLKKSVDLIEEAKSAGLHVTCSVTPYHLMLSDENLQQYDSVYKVNPPLREEKDILALRKALKEGIIDCIATHHFPQDRDSKEKEFEYAGEGMIGLESCFGVLGNALDDLTAGQKVQLLAVNPRKIFGLPIPEIKEGAEADLTLFDPDEIWTFEEKDIRSKSENSPFIKNKLRGKPWGIVNKESFYTALSI
jgi:dihydroorotase